ncbi:MAG: hypothetical protein HY521_03085 [Proteobacteria bacterium]|nr:hypothetical protein [Pseudomonadota bacterium]
MEWDRTHFAAAHCGWSQGRERCSKIGLAVHDDNVTTRFHFVSFLHSLGIGAKADIEAAKVD